MDALFCTLYGKNSGFTNVQHSKSADKATSRTLMIASIKEGTERLQGKSNKKTKKNNKQTNKKHHYSGAGVCIFVAQQRDSRSR